MFNSCKTFMKTKILINFIIFFSFQNLYTQFKVEQIIGNWESFETESVRNKKEKNISITQKNESNYKKEHMSVVLKFNKNNQMEYTIDGFGEKAKYKLKDSILTMGTTNYTIVKLSKNLLVLRNELFSIEENYKRIENKKNILKE